MHQGTQTRVRASARLTIATCGLGLLVAFLLLTGGRAKAAVEGRPRPSFVVIQTDDQTLEQLSAIVTAPGGTPIEVMPNTRALIAERGVTFSRYYTPYSLCAPSRASLLTGRYAHNNDVRGNVPPEGGYPGFASRAAYTHNLAIWLQAGGYRTIHVGKFLNGYGEPPYSSPTEVAARVERLAHRPQLRHRPLLLRLHAQRQRLGRRPLRRFRQLGNPRIRAAGRLRLPDRAAERSPLLSTRPTSSIGSLPKSCWGRPKPRPSTCSSTTPPPTATSAGPPVPSRRRSTTTPSPEPRFRTTPRRDSTRATSTTSRASSARRRSSRRLKSIPTGSTTRRRWSRCARSTTASNRSSKRSARCTASATPTSSSPPTTASSTASIAWSAASSSPTSPRPTCPS